MEEFSTAFGQTHNQTNREQVSNLINTDTLSIPLTAQEAPLHVNTQNAPLSRNSSSNHLTDEFSASFTQTLSTNNLDEMFLNCTSDTENFDADFVRNSNQQDLDSLFGTDPNIPGSNSQPVVVMSNHSSPYNRSGIANHHKPDANAILTVPYMESMNNEPLPVCSTSSVLGSHFIEPSCPPPGTSQHNSYIHPYSCIVDESNMTYTQPLAASCSTLQETSIAPHNHPIQCMPHTSTINQLTNSPKFNIGHLPSSYPNAVQDSRFYEEYGTIMSTGSNQAPGATVPTSNMGQRCGTIPNYSSNNYPLPVVNDSSAHKFCGQNSIASTELLLPASSANVHVIPAEIGLHHSNQYATANNVQSEYSNVSSDAGNEMPSTE
ncbi:hypothetical protein EB796_001467 [Bugula neritina]|uniref:Uncharacterized protein n=1 Tax=Bugula neritina TaxID=10212 RepID=A0A7J7KQB2_BUGNE|nr:hypothetical protein EB796_001467 [Bugula neritina]